jgi:hypothetical protein
MYLKFIMFLIWMIAFGVFILILLKSLFNGDVNGIRISITGIAISWLTTMAIYKDY